MSSGIDRSRADLRGPLNQLAFQPANPSKKWATAASTGTAAAAAGKQSPLSSFGSSAAGAAGSGASRIAAYLRKM
jgi:hypothetical protein